MAGFFLPLVILGLIVGVPAALIWRRRKKRTALAAQQPNDAPPQPPG
jgi:LPXTG-motif cell wall-anchored protein